jgi:nucleolin
MYSCPKWWSGSNLPSFGYVQFDSTPSATAAIEAKHQSVFEGRRIIVNYQVKSDRQNRPKAEPSKTLYIGNLAFEMSDADLNKMFRDIKNVIDVRVAIDRRTGQPRGFAHADFVDVESAVKGLEALQGQEVYGRVLRVDFSGGPATRQPREGGFGGDRYGGDRSRGDRSRGDRYGGDRYGGDRYSGDRQNRPSNDRY